MGFGKRVTKKSSPKKVNKAKQDKINRDKEIRENLISDRIKGIVKCADIECCNIEHIRKKMSGIQNIEYYVKKCAEINGFIFHRGWIYSKLWTIQDINDICNSKIVINDFVGDNQKIDNDLLLKLTALYQKENEPIKVTWFEGLITRGVLHMTEEQLYQSLERLMRAGKVYEPHIGMFAPTFDSL